MLGFVPLATVDTALINRCPSGASGVGGSRINLIVSHRFTLSRAGNGDRLGYEFNFGFTSDGTKAVEIV